MSARNYLKTNDILLIEVKRKFPNFGGGQPNASSASA
jgi:hypothetical protein